MVAAERLGIITPTDEAARGRVRQGPMQASIRTPVLAHQVRDVLEPADSWLPIVTSVSLTQPGHRVLGHVQGPGVLSICAGSGVSPDSVEQAQAFGIMWLPNTTMEAGACRPIIADPTRPDLTTCSLLHPSEALTCSAVSPRS
jgi:hypothetical protein